MHKYILSPQQRATKLGKISCIGCEDGAKKSEQFYANQAHMQFLDLLNAQYFTKLAPPLVNLNELQFKNYTFREYFNDIILNSEAKSHFVRLLEMSERQMKNNKKTTAVENIKNSITDLLSTDPGQNHHAKNFAQLIVKIINSSSNHALFQSKSWSYEIRFKDSSLSKQDAITGKSFMKALLDISNRKYDEYNRSSFKPPLEKDFMTNFEAVLSVLRGDSMDINTLQSLDFLHLEPVVKRDKNISPIANFDSHKLMVLKVLNSMVSESIGTWVVKPSTTINETIQAVEFIERLSFTNGERGFYSQKVTSKDPVLLSLGKDLLEFKLAQKNINLSSSDIFNFYEFSLTAFMRIKRDYAPNFVSKLKNPKRYELDSEIIDMYPKQGLLHHHEYDGGHVVSKLFQKAFGKEFDQLDFKELNHLIYMSELISNSTSLRHRFVARYMKLHILYSLEFKYGITYEVNRGHDAIKNSGEIIKFLAKNYDSFIV